MEDLEKRKLLDDQEREKRSREDENGPDVEAHKFKKHSEDGSEDDTPDVEAHRFKV
jgi:hypothetical protein